jgi:hypothetical protein
MQVLVASFVLDNVKHRCAGLHALTRLHGECLVRTGKSKLVKILAESTPLAASRQTRKLLDHYLVQVREPAPRKCIEAPLWLNCAGEPLSMRCFERLFNDFFKHNEEWYDTFSFS